MRRHGTIARDALAERMVQATAPFHTGIRNDVVD